MDARAHRSSCRVRGAALVIVLAFVVLLTFLVVAYLSRTTSDRQVTQVSFNQTKVDQVATSAMELIIGGLRQEITGPSPTPTPPYLPATNANMLPLRSGNPGGVPDPIPNMVRRSVRADPIPAPGISSLASAVNSTTDVSTNGRSISSTRWNGHYLVPKKDTTTVDSIPIDAFTSATPDWVILTRNGPVAFAAWDPTLANAASTNNNYAVGRYAYAIYDEGGLLDANVAGYPNGTTPDQAGRKGPVAFADLTALPSPSPNPPSPYFPNSTSPYQVDRLVGWRNYGSTQPTNNFPNVAPAPAFAANFLAGSGPALAYWNSVITNTTGFLSASGAVAANGRTDQMFLSRQQLLAYRAATLFNVNALQYLGTFFRELNAPTWKPSTPTTPTVSSIDYAALANTPTASTSTAINRDLLYVRVGVPVGSSFTRADGTTAAVGDLLIKQRFPLSRINGLADPTFPTTAANSTINNGFLVPATAATVQRDFGLLWNSANNRWNYVGATGSTVQSTIERLDQVVAENREPNFFELLKTGILSGSVGSGSSGATFVAADPKYVSSDYQIMQIGANIIDQWDSDNIPTFINFGSPASELAGIENLPYLNKLVFKPYWTLKAGKYHFDAWLLPSLWNPHQNAPPASQNVRIVMTAGTLSATTANPPFAPPLTMTSITGGANQYMTVDAKSFGAAGNPSTNNPSAPTAFVDKPNPPGTITASPDAAPGPYYGFHVNNSSADVATAPGASTTAQPNIAGCTFQLQVDVTGKGNWKAYQTWTGCANSTPLICSPTGLAGNTTLQDPEFVTLDPRTLRFGVWGNAAKQSTIAADYAQGTQGTLDWPAPAPGPRFELITALPPVGANFSSPASTNLYLYAKNDDGTVHYTDLDTIQRRGDIISGSTTPMLPGDFVDRPQILNRPFQSMAELGQVFRDQPWKTLDFGDFIAATAPGADAGLLDIFTLHESSMEAGKTSLNTRQTPVLTAILSKATTRSADGTTAISSTQRDSIVNALVALQPMVRKTDLLTGLAGNATVTALGTGTLGSIKEARESVIRAFSDAGQTRTWNLMIDVIAQSGRYPPNASTLAGFLIEGEQHYWVHVAIDRFTGQVIDKQIEVVQE